MDSTDLTPIDENDLHAEVEERLGGGTDFPANGQLPNGTSRTARILPQRKMTIEEAAAVRQRRRTDNLAELRRVLTLVQPSNENFYQFDTLLQDDVSCVVGLYTFNPCPNERLHTIIRTRKLSAELSKQREEAGKAIAVQIYACIFMRSRMLSRRRHAFILTEMHLL